MHGIFKSLGPLLDTNMKKKITKSEEEKKSHKNSVRLLLTPVKNNVCDAWSLMVLNITKSDPSDLLDENATNFWSFNLSQSLHIFLFPFELQEFSQNNVISFELQPEGRKKGKVAE